MASISLHFVTLLKGTGDVGALNAKDASKETDLALLGILCAILAGGSKASISLPFATPLKGMGDVDDLNAKGTSKKTVLAFSVLCTHSQVPPQRLLRWLIWNEYSSVQVQFGILEAVSF